MSSTQVVRFAIKDVEDLELGILNQDARNSIVGLVSEARSLLDNRDELTEENKVLKGDIERQDEIIAELKQLIRELEA